MLLRLMLVQGLLVWLLWVRVILQDLMGSGEGVHSLADLWVYSLGRLSGVYSLTVVWYSVHCLGWLRHCVNSQGGGRHYVRHDL